jgi:hypothetical protein
MACNEIKPEECYIVWNKTQRYYIKICPQHQYLSD